MESDLLTRPPVINREKTRDLNLTPELTWDPQGRVPRVPRDPRISGAIDDINV